MSAEGKDETEGKVVLMFTGALEGNNVGGIWGEERCSCFAGLSQQLSAFPEDCVCGEGVRKQPPLTGNRDAQLAGRMVGDPPSGEGDDPHTSRTHKPVWTDLCR